MQAVSAKTVSSFKSRLERERKKKTWQCMEWPDL